MPHAGWTEALERQHALALYRTRYTLDSPQGAELVCDGRRLVNFASNDYLGLANHAEVAAALMRGAERYGVGAGASHLICGHGAAHQRLEEELAAFVGCERALLFSTGYMANLGVITALAGRGAAVFADRLNHASLVDGALLSRARLRRYPHRDCTALAGLLADSRAAVKLVVSDGVFSMDGDIAPMPDLVRVCADAEALLMIDDAHGLGVLGIGGGGTLEHFRLPREDVTVLVGTLGKALGTFGAFVAGRSDLVDYLIQTARTYRYTTAMPPAIAEATRAALALVQREGWRRERLAALIERLRAGAEALGIGLLESMTPIQVLLIGDNRDAIAAGEALRQEGFWVGTIRPPTVPAGSARLRITLSAAHDEQQIDGLLAALARLPGRCRPC